MPKIIELTIQIDIQKVSCPGVWLCQDGRVSLTVHALGASYQTCLLPPVFPLIFKDIFYFQKRFEESCALNNICCLLRDETIYWELVQWSEDCRSGECVLLAQYLGALNDVLFPPNMCSNDGVDLLMRRTKEFPGILAPKIEITTKVRIDEVVHHSGFGSLKVRSCQCSPRPDIEGRQRQVCHTAKYHRNNCNSKIKSSRSRSRSRSGGSRSCCRLSKEQVSKSNCCNCSNPLTRRSRISICNPPPAHCRPSRLQGKPCPEFNVYNVSVPNAETVWREVSRVDGTSQLYKDYSSAEDKLSKSMLESRYIDEEAHKEQHLLKSPSRSACNITPCICDICKRYYDFFHIDNKNVKEYLNVKSD